MNRTKVLIIGALVVLILLGIAVGSWVMRVATDPTGIAVSIDGPLSVEVGENFTMAVVVANQRTEDALKITDVDIADAYLGSFLLVGTTPAAESSMNVPLTKTRSFTFNKTVPAGEELRFEFELRSTSAGLFRGDVDVWEGQQFLTQLIQTNVVATD